MLPRQGFFPKVPMPKYSPDERENTKSYGNRTNSSNSVVVPKPKMVQVINQPGGLNNKISQQQQQQRNRVNAVQSVINSVNNANTAIAANMSAMTPNLVNNFVGSRQLPVQQVEENIGELSEKHDEYIELILEEE